MIDGLEIVKGHGETWLISLIERWIKVIHGEVNKKKKKSDPTCNTIQKSGSKIDRMIYNVHFTILFVMENYVSQLVESFTNLLIRENLLWLHMKYNINKYKNNSNLV